MAIQSVVVKWADADGRERYLPNTTPDRHSKLDFKFHLGATSESYQLQVPLRTSRSTHIVNFLIPPERVASLDIGTLSRDVREQLPWETRTHLGSEVVWLRFNIRGHADLFQRDSTPTTTPFYLNVMSLAETTAFTLYLSDLEPQTEEKLRLICDVASESRGREELQAAKKELQTTKEEMEANLEVYTLTDDKVDSLIDQAVNEIRDEMHAGLSEVLKLHKGLDQAIDELEIYTTGEVEERLYEVQEHCEGLNHPETEDMVLGAQNELENDVREEISDTKRDLQSWYQRRVQPKIAKMIEAKVQAAEGRVMDAVRVNMGQMIRRRRHHGHGPVAFESGQRFRRRLRTAWLRAEEAMRRVEATREASIASTDSADERLFVLSNHDDRHASPLDRQ
ncbi:hypothetical protein SLS53_005076 [Cytospora paraplurivora]|uniref:Uncharacterized protein n=1 Tax=Cytospora paraplurivora TaxID=2898453 RepID=A0AAN9U6U3_9PEZI